MSGIFGKPPAATVPTQLNSINVDQSRYGDPVPLVYGVQRIKMTLGWYGDFTSTAQYSSGGKGGKGPPSSYSYAASCVMLLCEGPVNANPALAIKQVWKDKDLTTLSTENLTFFNGASGQAPWSYLTENFPSQAVPYDHTVYVAEANLSLGGSAALPNYTFEVVGFLAQPGTAFSFVSGLAANSYQGQVASTGVIPDGIWDVTFSDNESRTCTFLTTGGVQICSWDSTLGLVNGVSAAAIAGGYDAEPSAILIDYCTDVNHGAGFNNLNTAQITTHSWSNGTTTYYDSFKTYCTAYGLFISPWEDTQRAATDFIKDLLEIGNSNCLMSAGSFKVIPYGDVPITGNGVTYTPNLQPLFSFTDSDYMKNNQGNNDDPVVVIRKPLTETYNVVRVEFLDRGNSYNTALAEWTDPLDIAINGIRVMSNKSFHQICDARVANQVAALVGQRQLYVRNTYQFTVRADYSILEPMDLVSITDSNLGITDLLVRITETQDDKDDIFTITAEDVLVGTASAPKYNFQFAQGYAADFNTVPFLAAAPVVFSVPAALVGPNGGYELAIAVGPGITVYGGGSNGDWGGCDAWGSLDGVTYRYIGRISGAARYGTTLAAITATAASVNLQLTAGAIALGLQLENATAADFAANRALMYLDGEIIGFENVTSIGSGEYNVSISRGLFGTGPSPGVGLAHSSGASWARLDQSILYFPFDAGMVGQTLDLEFTAFNSVGRNEQTQSEAIVYTHVIELQNGSQLLGGPLTLVGSGMGINGTAVFKSANTSAFDSGVWSLQGYTGGAFMTFAPSDTTSQGVMGLFPANGLLSSLTGANGYAFYCDAGTLYANENGTNTSIGTYAAGDVLTIVYDGQSIAYQQNSNQIRKITAASGLTLYLNSLFATYQDKFSGISFGPYGASTPVLWATRGNAYASDSLIFKEGGTSTWTSDDVYSINAYPTCNLVWKENSASTLYCMGGLITAIPSTPNYTGINYAIECRGSTYQIFESGTAVSGATGSCDGTTRFSITYDGSTITYAADGTTIRTVSVSGLTLFGYFNLYSPNVGANSVDFGPGSTVPLIDTGGLGSNAASQILSAVNLAPASTDTASSATVSETVCTSVIAATGSPVAIDASTNITVTYVGAGVVGYVTMSIERDGVAIGGSATYKFDASGYAGSTYEAFNIPVTLVATDNPSAGSHTYTVVFAVDQTNYGSVSGYILASYEFAYIKVREIKK